MRRDSAKKIAAGILILLKFAHGLSNVCTMYTGRKAVLNRVGFLPVLDITEIQQGGLQTKVWLASAFRTPVTYAWKKIPWCHSRSLELAWICRETIKNEEKVKFHISWNSGTCRSTPILGKSPASKAGIFWSALHMQRGVHSLLECLSTCVFLDEIHGRTQN